VTTAREAELRLEAVEQPRAHEYVAEQLRREIALRVLPPTAPLPPERDLARIFRVSRATVQLAMRLLEREGLIERRRGRNGGTFVIEPAEEAPTALLAGIAEKRTFIEETLDFRAELEPAAAAQAAGTAGSEDLDAIERAAELAEAAKDDAEFMRYDTEFHLAVARASHNRYFERAVVQSRVVLNDVLPALPETALWHARTHRQHAAVLEALRAGSAPAARRAMLQHVRDTDRSVRALLAALDPARPA